MSLVNPMYEVGIQYPINQVNRNIQTKLNLPIPKNVIFFREFKAGDTLPISFKASGDLISLDSSPQTITFMKDIFIKATKEEILFSLDQSNWKQFQNIFSGNIEAKVMQSDDNDPTALIHLIANSIMSK